MSLAIILPLPAVAGLRPWVLLRLRFRFSLWDRFRFCGAEDVLTDLIHPTCGDVGLMSSGCMAIDSAGGLGVSALVLFAIAGRRRD